MELQPTLTVILGFGIPYILYQKSLCLFLVCNSPTLSGISTLSQEGVSTPWSLQHRLTMVLDLGFLIYSTRSYCAYFWCATLQHFQVFLLLARMGGRNTLESQFRLTKVLGFGIPYILYQKLLCLLLVCTSPTHSGISTLSQDGVKSLWGLSSD